ncbi:MAG: DNA adenine methylase [Candidatus Aminicenantes bacterium]|nr:DNA adenine methylase [Candidatus Aminicenantes bacterium]
MQILSKNIFLLDEPTEIPHKNFVFPIPETISFEQLSTCPKLPPNHWQQSCVHSECTLHQLSPYIGKLKSSISHDLIQTYSKRGDLVVDPFSGSGTVPLEAALLGRRVFAADISPYARILNRAKLSAPQSLEEALNSAEIILSKAENQPDPDLNKVPGWVQKFFHPLTLKEAIKFALEARKKGNEFLMACFLGILHHERPGFLSFPASHLVPYLRDRKYPPQEYPELYVYRELRPRLIAKIKRAYKRKIDAHSNMEWTFRQSKIEKLSFPVTFDCLITSPPYMNTLDYGRDNRLRLWFIDPNSNREIDNPVTKEKEAFQRAIACMAQKINFRLKKGGYCILVVGERLSGSRLSSLSENICQIMEKKAPRLLLYSIIKDYIPDIRRSRRNCKATKAEHILVFQRH